MKVGLAFAAFVKPCRARLTRFMLLESQALGISRCGKVGSAFARNWWREASDDMPRARRLIFQDDVAV